MHRLFNYLKFISIFMILELMITFITSLLNLLGVNSGITTIILLVFNIILFFVLNFINAKNMKKRGYFEGLLLGCIFIVFMYIIKLILFANTFKVSTLIYYSILLITSVFGGMFGINKKNEE